MDLVTGRLSQNRLRNLPLRCRSRSFPDSCRNSRPVFPEAPCRRGLIYVCVRSRAPFGLPSRALWARIDFSQMILATAGFCSRKYVSCSLTIRIDRRAGLAVAEFLLRLSLKLGLLDLNADDRCKALADILTGQSAGSLFFQKLIFLRIIVKSLRQRVLETSQMGTALRCVDIVDEGIDIFRVGIVVLHRHLDKYLVLDALAVDNRSS